MNITVEPATDETYIKAVLFSPTIYPNIRDDSCPQESSTLYGADIMAIPGFFLKVAVDAAPAGLFWLIWKGRNVEAHTALLENCRGLRAIKATKAAINWIFSNTEAEAIDSYAWSDCPAVKWFCRAVGLKEGRTEKWPNTRNGKPVDITYYSLERGTL